MKSKHSLWLFAVLIGHLTPLVVGDECNALVKSFSLDWAVVEGKSSYCSHDSFCDGIVLKASNSRGTVFTDGQLGYVKFGRVTSLSKRIPCEWAFKQVMILSQRKLIPIETPPVTPEIDPFDYLSATTSERQYNRLASMDEQSIDFEDDDDVEYNIREWIETRYTSVYSRLNELEAALDTLVEDRILPEFPRLVYQDEIDGDLFRRIKNLTDKLFPENVHMDSEIIHHSHELIRMSSSFRRFFWTGSLLMEYLVNNGLSFDQTQTYLVSFTPFLHSLSYFVFRTKFVLPRYFADYQSVIKSATKYHPLYLDDPLWYIQLAPEFLEPGPISSDIDCPDPADFPDMVRHWWSQQEEEGPTYIQLLEMFISRLSGNESSMARDSSHAHQNGLAQIVFILRYFGEYQYETHFAPIVQELNRICAHYSDWIEGVAVSDSIFEPAVQKLTISGLLSLCRDNILTVSRLSNLHTIASLADSEVTIRLRDQSRQIWIDMSSTVDSDPFVDLTLARFAQLDKFILAGKITLSFVLAEDVTGGYPGGISEFYRNVLNHIFDPSNGYFERTEITPPPPRITRRGRMRVRRLRVERIYKYKARVPSTDEEVKQFIGIGRLLAAIVRDSNPGSSLDKYYRQCLVAFRSVGSPPPPMTVFEGFFFGSDYIRRGFYDVFLSDGIERMFTDACEAANALVFIGATGFVFQTVNDGLVTN